MKICVGGEAILLFHIITHGKISICSCSLREKYRIVESKKLISTNPVEVVEQEIIFVRQIRSWLNQIENESTRHDGSTIQHRVVRFVWR